MLFLTRRVKHDFLDTCQGIRTGSLRLRTPEGEVFDFGRGQPAAEMRPASSVPSGSHSQFWQPNGKSQIVSSPTPVASRQSRLGEKGPSVRSHSNFGRPPSFARSKP